MVKRGDENSRPSYVLDSARGNYSIVAEITIKPGVEEKLGSLFGDPIIERVRRSEQFVKRLARGGMVAMYMVHL